VPAVDDGADGADEEGADEGAEDHEGGDDLLRAAGNGPFSGRGLVAEFHEEARHGLEAGDGTLVEAVLEEGDAEVERHEEDAPVGPEPGLANAELRRRGALLAVDGVGDLRRRHGVDSFGGVAVGV